MGPEIASTQLSPALKNPDHTLSIAHAPAPLFSFTRRVLQRISACKSATDSIINVGHPHLRLKWRCEKRRAIVQQFSRTDKALRERSHNCDGEQEGNKKRLAPLTGEGVSITSRFAFRGN